MPALLLASKFSLPMLRRTYVPRTQVLQRLNQGMREGHLLTLVSAPAGYGKTTVIRMWVEDVGCPVAWVTLERSDNDLKQFLTYVLSALHQAVDHLGQDALDAVANAQEIDLRRVAGLLINQLYELDQPVVLVLEEYHLIENEKIDQFIALVLNQAVAKLHLVIATREDPNLPLTRLRVRNQLTEIRAAHLSFSLEEVSDFYTNVMDVSLSQRELEILKNRTEGWVAGLQLAALSLKQSEDPARFVEAFRGTHRHILNYLIEEVVDSQPAEVRQFLRRTSILDQLSPSLCKAVTGQQASGDYLHYLEDNNIFLVALDEERAWYRYHALFGELLKNQLMQVESECVAELHERAAEWYRAHGFIQKAVEHALASSQGSTISRLIEGHALSMLYQGEVSTVVGWFDRLPEALLLSSPMMCVGKAWALALQQRQTRTEEVRQALQAAADALRQADADPTLRDLVAGHTASIHAYLLQTPALVGHAPAELIETSQRAQRLLPESEKAIRSVNALNIGHAYSALADLPAAERAFHQAFEEGMAGGNYYAAIYGPINLIALDLAKGQPKEALQACEANIARFNRLLAGQRFPPIGALHVLKGSILLEENRLVEAEHELAQGLSLIRHTGEYEAYVGGHSALARLRSAQGDWAGMSRNVDLLEEVRPEVAHFVQALRHHLAAHNWVNDKVSQEEAQRWLAQAAVRFDALPAVAGVDPLCRFQFHAHLCAACALTRLAMDSPHADSLRDVHGYLARQEEFAQTHGLIGWLAEIGVVRALVYRVQGRMEDARRALRPALRAAAARGYFRIFLDEGDLLRALLESPELCQEEVDLAPFVGRLLAAMPEAFTRSPASAPDHDRLSDRELEVLRLLAGGQSYKEIGQRLFLSLNTVQFHVKNVYGKLAVNKRVQAIEKARELNLI